MNYKQSEKILEKLKVSDSILLNCHENPDLDSLASAVSLMQVLEAKGKKVKIICPDGIAKELKFLQFSEKVESVDFEEFKFNNYDLFITTDTASWERVVGGKDIAKADISVVVIDHHATNTKFGEINLVDPKMSSTCELLYYVFEDWGIEITEGLATTLLAGIIADTDTFRYRNAIARTLRTSAKLIDLGAKKQEIIFNYYRRYNPLIVKFMGEILSRIEIDKEGKFVWGTIPNKLYKKYEGVEVAKDIVLDSFARSIKGTNFALIMTEKHPKSLSVSLRSRKSDFDVSEIALSLGGGGHKVAAGAKIDGLDFDAAVIKVLEKVREYAGN